ncbi:hypothetical protein E1B28_002831 [Marasmius oreades]|uniref:Uncharacterized protein n=1 Tax=Marasmius oreades TaxID=181124 RepID=A0A9P7UMD4_9AGAR|nr:uncharacterized protein E1B28_002831 [Marasmius oreades]KAG7086915.1 hypothetical protein E1B28_002831 [Marasmius oreades]
MARREGPMVLSMVLRVRPMTGVIPGGSSFWAEVDMRMRKLQPGDMFGGTRVGGGREELLVDGRCAYGYMAWCGRRFSNIFASTSTCSRIKRARSILLHGTVSVTG